MWQTSQTRVMRRLCTLPFPGQWYSENSSSFPFQVPLAHNSFGLIGPNAGLGFAIGKQ